MEANKGKSTVFGSSIAKEKDMISKLPDSLISQILSYLPTQEVVRTSVLSNRWRNLWLLIPGLDLDSDEFSDYNAFTSFIDGCLDFSREENSCLHKVKLSIHKDGFDYDGSCVKRWIDFVVKRKLKHLDIEFFVMREWEMTLDMMPLSLLICETLVYLSLRQVSFDSFEDSSSVTLPSLKTMRLELNIYANEKSLELLISSCPVLEDLSIVRREDDNVKVLRVCSQTLTSLNVGYFYGYEGGVDILLDDDFDYRELGVLIDAPRLKYLNFQNEISESKTITNSVSLTKVNILGKFDRGESDDQVRKFFTCLSRVNDLKISSSSFSCITKMVPLPQFDNLCCLEVEFHFYNLETMPRLLASCPNLKSLILDLKDSLVGKQMELSPVPLCLVSSLEFVEIKCSFYGVPILELGMYFTENSVILKKLVLCLTLDENEENPVVFNEFLALPRRSSTCQIIVCS